MTDFHLGIMFADGSIMETFEKSFFLETAIKKVKSKYGYKSIQFIIELH